LRSFNAVGNPNFEIDQRNVGLGITNPATGNFVQDRWSISKPGSVTGTANSTRPVATVLVPGTNFRLSGNCQTITLATQQASLAATDYYFVTQFVEGINMRELISDVHSVSLLVRSSVAPLKFGLALRDVGATRSLCKLCTISSANTWTLISLPNLPVWSASGTWNIVPGVMGYSIAITLAAGVNFTAPVNDTWQNGNFPGAAGQDNFFSKTVGSTFDIGFMQHEPGAVCSTLMDRSWQQNYDDCLRYYDKSYNYDVKAGAVSGSGAMTYMVVASQPAYAQFWYKKPLAVSINPVMYSSTSGTSGVVRDATASTDRAISSYASPGQKGFSGADLTARPATAWLCQAHYTVDSAM
jgi:hypothetical protein